MKLMKKQRRSHLFLKGELKNKYHIRKFSMGIASVMFGSLFYLSMDQQAQAAETNTQTAPMTDTNQQTSNTSGSNIAPSNTNNSTTTISDTTLQKNTAPQSKDIAITDTAVPTNNNQASQSTSAQSPTPQAQATSVNDTLQKVHVEGVQEQVYTKSIDVYPQSEVAKTAKMQRGIYQAREDLGIIVPANKQFYIRQAPGSNESDLNVDLMTNDRQKMKKATISSDGSWTHLSTDIASAPFVHIPTGLSKEPVVEYYVENNEAQTLPTYRKGGNKQAFDAAWQQSNASYGYVDGDKIAFLIPNVDRQKVADLGKNPGPNGFKDLDDMIHFYEDVINHYDNWVGLSDDINSVNYNVGQKYFTVADAHGPGLAYYSTSNMGSNSPSMSGYLEKGWLALHEVGHGYDGAMTYDPKMELIEVENNILANQYQSTIMGVQNGWLYEGRQAQLQKGFNDQLMNGTLNFANGGFRGRLDFMTKMVRLTGIEGFTDLWKGIRQEEADMAHASKPFTQDVPRWINTYWLADNGINGTAYFDLYQINLPQILRNQLDTYNNTYTYPLSLLINNPEEQQRLTQKLGLATPYELVKSSDLADTTVRADAAVNINLNGQVLPENVKVSLMEGTKEIANAEVLDGKAVFHQVRAGVYKIIAPLSTTYALPESAYIVVKENGDNQATLNYPKNDNVQDNVTETISLRGLSNIEFASASYNPDKKQIVFKQNAAQPHVYFTDEYAHITIQKADGTNVLDRSYIGNKKIASETQTFDLNYGDKVIVHHREPAARRSLVRNETKESITVPYADQETVTYTLTDKGLIVNNETQADANRRYDDAIKKDVAQISELIKQHPEKDYRSQLFKVLQGIEYVDSNIKDELLNTINPLIDTYKVHTPSVIPIEAGSTSIRGTGEAGSTITAIFKSGQKAEIEVPENGKWTIQLPSGTTLEHNDVTKVYATGKHGTVSSIVAARALDTIAPKAPTINKVEAGTKEVSGTAEAGSKVRVTFADGTSKEVEVNAEGKWTVESSTPLAYQAVIQAESIDQADNKSSEVSQRVEDTTAPKAPTINKVEAGTKEVSGTGEAGSKVKVTFADGTSKEVEVNAEGKWTIETSAPLAYQTVIKAESIDLAGNKSGEVSLNVVDTTAPKAPTINKVEAGTKEVSGTAEAGSKVKVTFADGTSKEVEVNAEGKWTVESSTPLAYQAVIKAESIDKAGNKSDEVSQNVEDTTAPKAPTINKVEAGTKEVSGTGEAGSKVKVTFADGTSKEVEVNAEGKWTTESSTPLTYQAVIKAESIDEAGNKSGEVSQSVEDTTAPKVPTINKVEAGTKEVSGTGEAGSKVKVTFADGTSKEVEVNVEGKWTVETSAPFVYQALIKAESIDPAGNKSGEVSQRVEDTTAPKVPTINKVEAGTKEVSGTGEAGSKVKVTFADGTSKEVEVNAEGKWTTESSTPLAYQAVIKAESIDEAGNKSSEVSLNVEDTTAPKAPVINSIKETDRIISGSAEANVYLKLLLPNGNTFETQVGSDGNWNITLPNNVALKVDEIIKVSTKDQAENQSEIVEVKVTAVVVKNEEAGGPINTPSETEELKDKTDKASSETTQPIESTSIENEEEKPTKTQQVSQSESTTNNISETKDESIGKENTSCETVKSEDSKTQNISESTPITPIIVNQGESLISQETHLNTDEVVECEDDKFVGESGKLLTENEHKEAEDLSEYVSDSLENISDNITTEVPSSVEENNDDNCEESAIIPSEDALTDFEEDELCDLNSPGALEEELHPTSAPLDEIKDNEVPSTNVQFDQSKDEKDVVDERKNDMVKHPNQPLEKHVNILDAHQGKNKINNKNIAYLSNEQRGLNKAKVQKVHSKTTSNHQMKSNALPSSGQEEHSNSPIGWVLILFGVVWISRIWNKKAKEEK